MYRTILTGLAILGVVFSITGCGGKQAETPQEAIANLREAMAGEDKDAFLCCFEDDVNYKGVLEGLLEVANRTGPYEDDVLTSDSSDKRLAAVRERWLEGAKCTEDGDKAVCELSDGKTRLDLVRVDGVWLIKAEPFIVAMSRLMGEHISGVTPAAAGTAG